MPLSNEEKRRYARQMVLPEMGESGQAKLKSSKVLVVGAGGLGSPVLLYLAAAGVGTIGIADGDKIELSNLQRQIIHESSDIGRAKTESAEDAIADLNPDIKIHTHERIDEKNAARIISGYDLIVDGSDDFATRFLVHDTCYNQLKPYIFAAVQGFRGQVSTFKGYLEGHPCYHCLCPEIPPEGTIPNCTENGVLGAVAGIVGTWQANEAIKELLQIGESLSGYVLVIDALHSTTRRVKLNRDTACLFCNNPDIQLVSNL